MFCEYSPLMVIALVTVTGVGRLAALVNSYCRSLIGSVDTGVENA